MGGCNHDTPAQPRNAAALVSRRQRWRGAV